MLPKCGPPVRMSGAPDADAPSACRHSLRPQPRHSSPLPTRASLLSWSWPTPRRGRGVSCRTATSEGCDAGMGQPDSDKRWTGCRSAEAFRMLAAPAAPGAGHRPTTCGRPPHSGMRRGRRRAARGRSPGVGMAARSLPDARIAPRGGAMRASGRLVRQAPPTGYLLAARIIYPTPRHPRRRI